MRPTRFSRTKTLTTTGGRHDTSFPEFEPGGRAREEVGQEDQEDREEGAHELDQEGVEVVT